MAKTGRRRKGKEFEASVKTFAEIQQRFNEATPPELPTQKLDELLARTFENEDLLMSVRALMHSIAVGNDHRVTPEEMGRLFDCGGWPSHLSRVSTSTISNFVNGTALRSARPLGVYLMILSVLRSDRHPAFGHIITSTLERTCEPLALFDALIGRRTFDPAFGYREIVRPGRSLYQALGPGGGGRIKEGAFDVVLDSSLFRGLEPYDAHGDLGAPTAKAGDGLGATGEATDGVTVEFTAIRLGYSGESYVASQLSCRMLHADFGDSQIDTYVYVRTMMKSPGAHAHMRSHGFVIPRRTDVYIAQHHVDGAGLNIASIPIGELGDARRRFYRGLILAVDRDDNNGALASRIVFVRRGPADKMVGTFKRHQLMSLFGPEDIELAHAIMTYLHAPERAVVRPADTVIDDDVEDLATWGDLQDYLRQPEVEALLKEPGKKTSRVSTYLKEPLTARETSK